MFIFGSNELKVNMWMFILSSDELKMNIHMNILQCSWVGKNTLTKKPWGIKVQAREKPHQRSFRGHSGRKILSLHNLITAARFYLYWPTGIAPLTLQASGGLPPKNSQKWVAEVKKMWYLNRRVQENRSSTGSFSLTFELGRVLTPLPGRGDPNNSLKWSLDLPCASFPLFWVWRWRLFFEMISNQASALVTVWFRKD